MSLSPHATFPICVVSDADREDLDAAMAHHCLAFTAVVTSKDVGARQTSATSPAVAAALRPAVVAGAAVAAALPSLTSGESVLVPRFDHDAPLDTDVYPPRTAPTPADRDAWFRARPR